MSLELFPHWYTEGLPPLFNLPARIPQNDGDSETEPWALPNTGPCVTAQATCLQRQPDRGVQCPENRCPWVWSRDQGEGSKTFSLQAPSPHPDPISHILANLMSSEERGRLAISWSALPPQTLLQSNHHRKCSHLGNSLLRMGPPVWFGLKVTSC